MKRLAHAWLERLLICPDWPGRQIGRELAPANTLSGCCGFIGPGPQPLSIRTVFGFAVGSLRFEWGVSRNGLGWDAIECNQMQLCTYGIILTVPVVQ